MPSSTFCPAISGCSLGTEIVCDVCGPSLFSTRLPQPAVEPDHARAVAERDSQEAVARALAHALAGLADTDRQVVSLCLLEEMSYEQAAQVLGLTHAAVRSRLMRARKQLRTALLEAGYHAAGEGEGDE